GYQGNDLSNPIHFKSIYGQLDKAGISWGCYFGNISFLWLLRDTDEKKMYPLEQFFEDAAAGRLPQVVVVEPLYGRNSDHPPEHPAAGQIFLSSIYDALAKGPQWARSLMMVTYDEHGGFFDHVPPPKAP